MRRTISLNDGWNFIQNGESVPVTLPHTWNTVDGQDGGNDYFRGTCQYGCTLEKPVMNDGDCVFLEIQGAAMSAQIKLNGEMIGEHQGGYSTFRVDLTRHLREQNQLIISVDNGINDSVYPQKADFTFYGGLYRSVNLIIVPGTHFDLSYYGSPGIKVTPIVNLESMSAQVTVETWQKGAGNVTVTVDGQIQTIIPEDGHSMAVFHIENVHLWDGLRDPYFYTAKAVLDSGDEVCTRFGCRCFQIDAQRGFLLNGHSYPLRGVSMHQDYKGIGNALLPCHHRQNMEIIREIGANTLRLAHYQQSQEFYDLCDENGIIVWAEIPYITMHMKNGRENTLLQMRELIVQCYNHPSIAVWGLSNEITAASAVTEDLLENHRLLHQLCHRMDSTRLTTMANVFMLETDSPLLEIPDVNSYNLYFGWYLGELEQNETFFDEFHQKHPQHPIGLSEYGADANPVFQAEHPERGDYTEGYQALYHEHMLAMIESRTWLWTTYVWNLFDFGADGRDEGGRHGENQKGLVTFDRQTKKDTFYLYKAAWNREPMVHLCGRRYIKRTGDVTEIKVYSNAPEVALYVDGRLFDTLNAHRIFRFQAPISGTHLIEARAAGLKDQITIQKVEMADPSYTYCQKQSVVNWFDQETFHPECYSVNDTLAELRTNPEAAAIVDDLIRKGASSRGDVAQTVNDNPVLQQMMGKMTLASLIKQAGIFEEESVRQMNRILQKIKKK